MKSILEFEMATSVPAALAVDVLPLWEGRAQLGCDGRPWWRHERVDEDCVLRHVRYAICALMQIPVPNEGVVRGANVTERM